MKIRPLINISIIATITGFVHCAEASKSDMAPLNFEALKAGVLSLKGGDWEYRFGSRQGVHYGMDSDSSILFSSSGRVILQEDGYVSCIYAGIYQIGPDGVISIKLANYPAKWPAMVLRRASDGFYLHRVDDKKGFESGGRSGSVDSSKMKPFWPFKLTHCAFYDAPSKIEDCPCCGYTVVTEWGFGFRICRVCFWVYDFQIQDSPKDNWLDVPSQCNYELTLTQARKNFQTVGACDPRVKELVVSEEKRKEFKEPQVQPK